MKEETEQALSWKQDFILGRTVDFELFAQYDLPTGKPGPLDGGAPGLVPRLSVA